MIQVFEIRDKTAVGSVEFSPKNLSLAEALKFLIKEFCQGAILVDNNKTELVLMVSDAGNAVDQVTFSGSEKEMLNLLHYAALFQITKFKNIQALERLFDIDKLLAVQAQSDEDPAMKLPEISKEDLKSRPIFIQLLCPIFFGENSQNLNLLLGMGRKTKVNPAMTDETIQKLLTAFEQDPNSTLIFTICPVHPAVAC